MRVNLFLFIHAANILLMFVNIVKDVVAPFVQ
jgi:hypothetical protein